MSSNTASDRFSILTNGIDSRLKIIRDNKTGFYNITKTAKMILDLKDEASSDESAGIPADSNKLSRPRQWIENADTTKMIAECKELTYLSIFFCTLELSKAFLKLMIDYINIPRH